MKTILLILCIILLAAIAALCALYLTRKNAKADLADIDLRGRKRPLLTVRLPKHLGKLTLTTPTKAISDGIASIGATLQEIGAGNVTQQTLRELYRACAVLLGANLENKQVTQKRLEATLTPDDCIDFLDKYLSWLTKLTSEKN